MKSISSNTAKTEFGLGATSTSKESIQKWNSILRLCNRFDHESIYILIFNYQKINCKKGADIV
jgi:hypothetical protein